MEIIDILGDLLAERVFISSPAARGLIKLSIKDEIGPFKPLEQMNLNDFLNSVQNALKKRLISLSIKNIDSIIKELKDLLLENQSLISITKI